MWENTRRKAIIRNVLVFLVLAAAFLGLRYEMKAVTKRINEEDAHLKEASTTQRQELNEARKENLEAVRVAYEQDMQTVADYLPGIVCWGDSLTAGSSGNVSYPGTLQQYIDAYLCGAYNFASTVEFAQGYSRLDWSQYTLSIPVVNMGSGREDSATVLGRSGVSPYVIGKSFEIPGDKEAVTITLKSGSGRDVAPLTAGNAGLNPVVIGGVEGTIALSAEGQGWGKTAYTFTRSEAGEPVSVDKGAEVISASTDAYRDYLHIVWLGNYGSFTNPQTLVKEVQRLLSRQASNPDRFLVLGPCTVGGAWTVNVNALDAIDSAMMQAFGNKYVNVRKYLMTDGMTDAGITPSKADSASISLGKVPECFRSNDSGADLNGTAYKLIAKLVYGRLDALGYFDEVRQELGLDKSTQEILKKDPNYFENLLGTK